MKTPLHLSHFRELVGHFGHIFSHVRDVFCHFGQELNHFGHIWSHFQRIFLSFWMNLAKGFVSFREVFAFFEENWSQMGAFITFYLFVFM